MDRRDANKLLERMHSNGTLDTAKELLQIMQPVMSGEKVATLPPAKKLLLMVAAAIEYGRELAAGDKQDPDPAQP